mgnify:CR=1 FL=1
MNPLPPTMSSSADAGSAGISPLAVIRVLRSGGKAILGQAALYGELACVEWAEEKNRLTKMFVIGMAAFACLLGVLLFTGVLVMAISWDTPYRIPAVLAMMVIYVIGVGIAWHKVRALSASSGQAFSVTREEFAADIALIKSKL